VKFELQVIECAVESAKCAAGRNFGRKSQHSKVVR
jgi:hypothetical protein